jgi:hypothetical protein
MKTTQRRSVVDAPAKRLNVRVSLSAYQRLGVHCAMTGEREGDVINRLIDGLKDFSMPARLADRVRKSDRLDVAAEVSLVDLNGAGAVQA